MWKDRKSKESQEQAEQVLSRRLGLGYQPEGPDEQEQGIKVCSVQDLKTVAQGLKEMGLALADLHTRVTGGPQILDLDETIKTQVVSSRAGTTSCQNHKDIVEGMKDLCGHLESHGMAVPRPPATNHFGEEGKHVLKVRIHQQPAPDPIVVAAKGANNFRQRGIRLLTGGCKAVDSDDSDYDSSDDSDYDCESDSSSLTSHDLDNRDAVPVTSVARYKNFVGAVVVVTTPLLHDNGGNNESDGISCSIWN